MENVLPSVPDPMEPYRLNIADTLGIRMQNTTEALVRPWATAATSMNAVNFSSYLDPAEVLAAKAASVSLVPRYSEQMRGIHDLYAGVSAASRGMKEMSAAAGLMPSELTVASELAARINAGLYSSSFSGKSDHFASVLGSPFPSTYLWDSLASSEIMKTAGLASSHLQGTQGIAEALKPVANAQVSALWEAAAGIASKAVRDAVLSDDMLDASRRKLEFFGSPSPVVAVDLLKTAPEIEDFVERVRETYPEEVEEVGEVWRSAGSVRWEQMTRQEKVAFVERSGQYFFGNTSLMLTDSPDLIVLSLVVTTFLYLLGVVGGDPGDRSAVER